MSIVWRSLEIQSVDPSFSEKKEEGQNLKNMIHHCSIVKLCVLYVLLCVKKEKKQNQPLTLLYKTNICSEKLSQPALLTFTKLSVFHPKLETGMGTIFSTAFLRFKLCTSVAYGC